MLITTKILKIWGVTTGNRSFFLTKRRWSGKLIYAMTSNRKSHTVPILSLVSEMDFVKIWSPRVHLMMDGDDSTCFTFPSDRRTTFWQAVRITFYNTLLPHNISLSLVVGYGTDVTSFQPMYMSSTLPSGGRLMLPCVHHHDDDVVLRVVCKCLVNPCTVNIYYSAQDLSEHWEVCEITAYWTSLSINRYRRDGNMTSAHRLTHRGLVTHICMSELGCHCFV